MENNLLNDRYRLDEELGQGGMGVVYRGYDTLLGREVAIKILNESSQARLGSKGQERLLNEAQSAARLHHPNIVSIFDAGRAGGFPFIVMELLDGESLYEIRPHEFSEITGIARQVSGALHHAHTHGVIHRDLKPENILVDAVGGVKLTDFGLARSATSRLSDPGMLVGTVLYLAPEAATGQEVNARTDLYALGVLLYEMVTGAVPFTADDPLAVISQHLYSPVVPPHVHRPDVPPALEDLILSLLEKQPECRPDSALEVQQALEKMVVIGKYPSSPGDTSGSALLLDRIVRGRLVGRERELEDVKGVLRDAYAGKASVLLVSGEPGVGKTRLVRELLAHAAVSGSKYLAGACFSEGGIPYSPFPELISSSMKLPGIRLDLPEFVMADLVAISPELRLSLPHISGQGIDPQSEQQRVFESVTAWATALAARAPVILFIDDVHWADTSTLFLLRHLARRLQEQRLLIVLTYREVELHDTSHLQKLMHDLNRERLSTRIKLSRLTREQTREMLATMLTPSGEIEDSLVDAIYRETEGNPFFIEEVTKALIEEGKLCFEEVCWVARNAGEINIPQSVRVTIQSRLARLPEKAQEALRVASFIGREFDFEVLRRASDFDEESLIDALENAERSQIISAARGRSASPAFSFVHALIPSTLRDGIGVLRRQRMHRRVALAIEEAYPEDESHLESLAYHYEMAGDASRAIDYYSRAAARALSVYANQEAERYSRQALEMEPGDPERAELLSVLGESLFRQSHYQQAADTWMEAIRLYKQAGAPDPMARLYAKAARTIWYTGDNARTMAVAQEGLAALEEIKLEPERRETAGLAYLLHETARAYRFNDQNEKALELCHKALEMAERLGLVEVQAEALATIGIMFEQPDDVREQSMRKSIALAEPAGLIATAMRAHVNLSSHLRDRMQLREGLKHLLKAIDLTNALGTAAWEHGFVGGTAYIYLELGDYQALEEAIDRMRSLRESMPSPEGASFFARFIEAKYLHIQGRWDEALSLFEECRLDERQREDPELAQEVRTAMALLLRERKQLEEAVHLIDEALSMSKQGSHNLLGFTIRCLQATLLAELGRFDDSAPILEEARQIGALRKPGVREPVYIALTEARISAAMGSWDKALELFESVAGKVASWEMKWEHAAILIEWASVYRNRRAEGDEEQRRLLLGQARSIYEKLGLPIYSEQTVQLLAQR